ncbi:MAG: MerR family transcriptional regulator [bacterium]
MGERYTISRLAAAAGVHVETVRYYQRRHLIPEPPRHFGRIRHYTETDAERLRFIKRAQAMGFTLAEIESLLQLRTRRSCRATRDLANRKLRLINERMLELRQLSKELAGLIAGCDANDDDTCCPAIERLGARSLRA